MICLFFSFLLDLSEEQVSGFADRVKEIAEESGFTATHDQNSDVYAIFTRKKDWRTFSDTRFATDVLCTISTICIWITKLCVYKVIQDVSTFQHKLKYKKCKTYKKNLKKDNLTSYGGCSTLIFCKGRWFML